MTRKSLTLSSRAHGLAWSTPCRKRITIALSFISLLAGTIIAVASAIPVVEPYAPAHRLYVREQVAEEKTTRILRDLQIEQAEGKRDAVRDKLYQWQDKLTEATDPEKKAFYRERVRETKDTQIKLEEQLRVLRTLRNSGN